MGRWAGAIACCAHACDFWVRPWLCGRHHLCAMVLGADAMMQGAAAVVIPAPLLTQQLCMDVLVSVKLCVAAF